MLGGRVGILAKQIHTYAIVDRPDIEVLVDGTWYPGELRQCVETDGEHIYNVSWRQNVGQTRRDNFPAAQIGEAE